MSAGGAKIFDLGRHDKFDLPGYESIYGSDHFFKKFITK